MAEPQKQQKTKTVTGKKKNAFVANDFAKNLGTCAAIRATFNLGNFVGKGNSAKELAANTKIPNMEDVYEIACVNLPEEAWKGKSVDAIFSYLAAKKTLNAYKEAEKKVVTQKGEEITDEAVLKNPAVMKDSNGKAYYQKYKREMFAEFESGIDAARTELMQGKPITDPYTKEKVDASKASKILNGVGKAVNAAGSQIGYILGLDKSNRDIYSKMLFSVIGGGKKLWAAAQKAAATAKAKNQEQGKEKSAETKPTENTPEEPKKEPEGQANNPESEEKQEKPLVNNETKDEGKDLLNNIKKFLNPEFKHSKNAWDVIKKGKDKFVKTVSRVLGKNIEGDGLPQLHKAFVLANVYESLFADTYISFILAEQALDLFEDETPEQQEKPANNVQPEQKESTYTEKVNALIAQAQAMIIIKDENEFNERYEVWKKLYAELVKELTPNQQDIIGNLRCMFTQLLPAAKEADQKQAQANAVKKENESIDAETTEVANKFLNMLREKYK